MIRRHLEGCAECRADLALLGHDAVVEVVPSLELGWDPFAHSGTEISASESPEPQARVAGEGPLRRIGEAVERGINTARDLFDSATDAIQGMFVPVMELRPVRSAQAINGALDLSGDTRAVGIPVLIAGTFPPDASVNVIIQSPDGTTILHRRTEIHAISPPNMLLLFSRTGTFTPGIYSLQVESAEDSRNRVEYRFEFRGAKG